MTSLTLESLEAGLRRPFAPEEIKFLPKSPMNKSGTWHCLALPYADKRTYEDRLNELAFGQWSTPPVAPCVAGNKLVVPVTVVLCGVPHTDFGEAFLSSQTRAGETRGEENSATEAYSQGFRRACAQFRLGRFLYSLPKQWVPYDPNKREIVLSSQEKVKMAAQMYAKAGLEAAAAPVSRGTEPAPQETPHEAAQDVSHEPVEAGSQYITRQEVAWIMQFLQQNPARIERVCTTYHVERLDLLTSEQARHLITRLHKQAATSKGA